ncbi:MAG: hypothetical protein AABZ60_05475, partial [Planctomycetota bacterium]
MTKLDNLTRTKEGEGSGIVGALLMGLTFTLTSFTCTSPFEELQEMIELGQKFYQKQKNLTNQIESKQAKGIPEDIQAIVEKATKEDWKSRYSSVKEFITDIERYRKNMRVSARSYNLSQIFWKWMKRNQRKVHLGLSFMVLLLVFCGYLKYQKHQEFQKNINEAKIAKILGEEQESEEAKLKHFLKGMHSINTALLMAPEHTEVNQIKLALSQSLVKSACITKNFQFASYFIKEVEQLKAIEQPEKKKLRKELDTAQTQLLREHQKRLDYWMFALKDPLPGMREDAILEISKMQEIEILNKLAEEIKKGTEYFLTDEKRDSKVNEYYEIMALALGSLENSEAGEILWECLSILAFQILRFEEALRPNADVQYMVTLVQALANSKTPRFS